MITYCWNSVAPKSIENILLCTPCFHPFATILLDYEVNSWERTKCPVLSSYLFRSSRVLVLPFLYSFLSIRCMYFVKVILVPVWFVDWQPWRLMFMLRKRLSTGTTSNISLCSPSSPLMWRDHLEAERYCGLYGHSLAGIEGTLAELCEWSFFAKESNIQGCQAGSFWLISEFESEKEL